MLQEKSAIGDIPEYRRSVTRRYIAKTRIEYDHTHKGERVRFYDYENAVTLLTDFWTEVDKILEQRITKP